MLSQFARPVVSIEGDMGEYFKYLSIACDGGRAMIDGTVAVTTDELEFLRSTLLEKKEATLGVTATVPSTVTCSHFNDDIGRPPSSLSACTDHSNLISKGVHLLHSLIHRNSNNPAVLLQLISLLRMSAFNVPESTCLSALDRDLIDLLKRDSSSMSVNPKIVIASTLSNRFAYFNSLLLHPKTAQSVVELLLDGLLPKHNAALRQMIATLALNVASTIPVNMAEGMSDVMTQLLCFLLEKLEDEKDLSVLEYKLATVGKILEREGEAAVSLVVGLNLEEGLLSLSMRTGYSAAPFASEILSLLRI
jgi:hypothetical protein